MAGGSIAFILMSLLSLASSFGIMGYQSEEAATLRRKIQEGKVTAADVTRLLNSIQSKAKGESYSKRNKISEALNNLSGSAFQSSGIVDFKLGDLRKAFKQAASKIEQLRNAGDVESSMADNIRVSFDALPDTAKANSKFETAYNSTWNSKKGVGDRTRKLAKDLADKVKSGRVKLSDLKDYEQMLVNGYNQNWKGWIPNTSGGDAMIEAEQRAQKAADLYQEANELGEKYAK